MTEEEVLQRANELVAVYGLRVEWLPGAKSVGVTGDARSYTGVLCLSGDFPGWDILAEVSTQISNTLGVNRVTFQVTEGQMPIVRNPH